MQSYILQKLLYEHPELFTVLEVKSIMEEELKKDDSCMNTDMIECCLKTLELLESASKTTTKISRFLTLLKIKVKNLKKLCSGVICQSNEIRGK